MSVRASHGHKSLPFAGDVCHVSDAEKPNKRDLVNLDVEINAARFKHPVEQKTQRDCQQQHLDKRLQTHEPLINRLLRLSLATGHFLSVGVV